MNTVFYVEDRTARPYYGPSTHLFLAWEIPPGYEVSPELAKIGVRGHQAIHHFKTRGELAQALGVDPSQIINESVISV